MSGFMRFVVRPGFKEPAAPIVGFNHKLFEEGFVYEITEIFDGEYAIKKLGPSPLGVEDYKTLPIRHMSNGRDFNSLYEEFGGWLIRTIDEIAQSLSKKKEGE